MNEMIIKIREDSTVTVESNVSGVKSFKTIAPESLLECIVKPPENSGIRHRW